MSGSIGSPIIQADGDITSLKLVKCIDAYVYGNYSPLVLGRVYRVLRESHGGKDYFLLGVESSWRKI